MSRGRLPTLITPTTFALAGSTRAIWPRCVSLAQTESAAYAMPEQLSPRLSRLATCLLAESTNATVPA